MRPRKACRGSSEGEKSLQTRITYDIKYVYGFRFERFLDVLKACLSSGSLNYSFDYLENVRLVFASDSPDEPPK